MVKIISFSNQKGGVGKTTTCINMSSYVADEFNKRVLLVDMDPQGNATTGLGFSKSAIKKSVYSVLINDEKASENILKTDVKNLDILPSNIELAGAEVELVYKRDREKVLKNALAEVKDNYDYIMIDCPPSLGLLTINALAAADAVSIPIQSEYYALEGLSQLMNTISLVKKHLNPKLQVDGVILTMYDSRSTISKQIAEEICKFFTKKVYEIIVPRNVRLVEASSYGKPVMYIDPKSNGAKAYRALSIEFLKRNEKVVEDTNK